MLYRPAGVQLNPPCPPAFRLPTWLLDWHVARLREQGDDEAMALLEALLEGCGK